MPDTTPERTDREVRLKFNDFVLCITFRVLIGFGWTWLAIFDRLLKILRRSKALPISFYSWIFGSSSIFSKGFDYFTVFKDFFLSSC